MGFIQDTEDLAIDPAAYTHIIRHFTAKVMVAEKALTDKQCGDHETYLHRFTALQVWREALAHIQELYEEQKDYDPDD